MNEETFLGVPKKCAIPHKFVRNRTLRTSFLAEKCSLKLLFGNEILENIYN